jgi:hypothetical protein
MSTITSKVSIQVPNQQPDFVQADHPDFVAFLKGYYEFLESAELKLTNLGIVASITQEDGNVGGIGTPGTILLEDLNRYRAGEQNTVELEDYDTVGGTRARTIGSFVNGETITGTTSKATAVIRCEDISGGSRLFISSQNKFIIDEIVTGGTSEATGVISAYTANPVQNVMQLLDYDDVDNTIDSFFTEFKEAYMRTIPDRLADGVDKRKLLKNIKDLYRAKGSKTGHKLFFRILLNEEVDITYPTKDMLRVSDGKWSDDSILRIYATNSTILLENSTDASDIFVLMEDGSQILNEQNVNGVSNLQDMIGQTITMAPSVDLTIEPGGAYADLGYPDITQATAVVDQVFQYGFNGETVTEIVLNTDSQIGTFYVGHNVSSPDNADISRTLYGKISEIIDKANVNATDFSSSQYFTSTDELTISSDTGNNGSVAIETRTRGTIDEIIVDAGGSGYAVGDKFVVDNSTAGGVDLAGEVRVVNGGFAPEAGTLTGQFRILTESGTAGYPGEMLMEEGQFTYETPTGTFLIGEIVTGNTSGATAKVCGIELDSKTIIYNLISGSFTLGETVYGMNKVSDGAQYPVTAYTAVLLTDSPITYIDNEEDLGMVATDEFILEDETQLGDSYGGDLIVQEGLTGDITDVRIIREGYGYIALPTITITTSGGTGGTVKAKGTNIGKIDGVNVINQGVHYTDAASLKFLGTTNFLCTGIDGIFDVLEEVTGGTSGATARFRSQTDNIGIIKLDRLSTTPFIAGETITGGTSSKTAVINSYTKTSIPGQIGTSVNRTGRFIGEDGFIDEVTKKIQDSYYYQDYSYVVKSATSIVDWRNDLVGSVHPAGWAVFGSVDIASLIYSGFPKITSVLSKDLFKIVFAEFLGMRLGTTDQGPLNPYPGRAATEPSDGTGKIYNPALKLGTGLAFTQYETLTGSVSGATGTFLEEVTYEDGVRVATYVPITGIFETGDTITGSNSGRTAYVFDVWGLLGARDRTLHHVFSIDMRQLVTGAGSGARPDYGDISRFSFRPSMVDTRTSTLTFTPNSAGAAAVPVYTANVPLTTLATGINDSATSIVSASAANFPTAGTIQIEDELIDYTGISTNTFTGCTRGQHGTSNVAHLANVRLDSVRWAQKQNLMPGYKIPDWIRGQNYEELTFAALANVNTKNKIGPQIQLTVYKT